MVITTNGNISVVIRLSKSWWRYALTRSLLDMFGKMGDEIGSVFKAMDGSVVSMIDNLYFLIFRIIPGVF